MLRILGRTSSLNVRKVLWTAHECALPFVQEPEWAGERSSREPAFLALNPNGLVPVVIADEGVLWESNAIARYFANIAGRDDLLPASPFARAEVERWMDWQATELNRAWGPAFLALVRNSRPHQADPEGVAKSALDWTAHILMLEAQVVRTGAYVAGETFTLADIVLGLSVQRWRLTPIAHPPTPALDAWTDRLRARPSAAPGFDPTIP
ncbi:glutathione S-transferase family protein [Phenylobacterium sp. J367]|uniref:glutathione S-transferase family protein n=1 Tax=Phenylobacterium sp. J367 TaxID=2898435 RepID=UPI002151A524|nr:glutathione S-transferase N-terminal domain-containing protein [Phenylobacterium sp. J367]MCR5879184.1 glutathione S-transferase N-terminal domain-containing protein [Phenylobacterium sp. J367]